MSGAVGRTTGALRGRAALVTGGSRGIGAAVVRRLAADGAAVASDYRIQADGRTPLGQCGEDLPDPGGGGVLGGTG